MTTGLRIAVLIKQVPKATVSQFDDRGRLSRAAGKSELNPYCGRALAHAVKLAADLQGTCTAITMGPDSAADVLREAQACGAHRAIHLCDRELAGADSAVTSRALAAAIRSLGHVDLVLAGRSSVDAATAVVPIMVAEELDVPHVGPAIELAIRMGQLHVRVQHDDADESAIVAGPAVVTVAERSIAPARAVPDAWPERLRGWRMTAGDLGAGAWGQAASPTAVRAIREARPSRFAVMTEPSQAAELITKRLAGHGTARPRPFAVPESVQGRCEVAALLDPFDDSGATALLGEAAAVAAAMDAHVLAISGGGEERQLSAWGADAVLRLSGLEPRPLSAALGPRLVSASAVLGSATPWTREVLARLTSRLRTGLIVDATDVRVDGSGALVACKPAGDAYEAEVVCRPRPQLVTLRTGSLPLRNPRRVVVPPPVEHLIVNADPAIIRLERTAIDTLDALDRASVVLAVGRGVDPADYGQLEPLRRLLGAEMAASRPVTDSAVMPRGRQVGITGRGIAPAIYVAIGISGSANHVSGIARAGTVVAVNIDPRAPIFGSADIGLVGDWHEVVPALCAELAQRLPG